MQGLFTNSLIMNCCNFGNLEIRTLKPNRYKNQSNDTLKLIGHNCHVNKDLLNKKLSLSIIMLLS